MADTGIQDWIANVGNNTTLDVHPELPPGKPSRSNYSYHSYLIEDRDNQLLTACLYQDVYPHAAASVTAALTVLRSLAGALLPLCALSMYDKLEMGWGNSLLAFVSLGLVPIPLLFYTFGPRLVKKFDVKL